MDVNLRSVDFWKKFKLLTLCHFLPKKQYRFYAAFIYRGGTAATQKRGKSDNILKVPFLQKYKS